MGASLVDAVEVRRASSADMNIIANLLQLHAHDISEFEDADVDEEGLFHYDSSYYEWTEKDQNPFLIRVAGKIVGFVLMVQEEKEDHSPFFFVADFFILKKYRGQGIGQAAAFQLFDLFPGEWQVSELSENLPAQAFWRKIIARYTGGPFEEEIIDDGGLLQIFHSPRNRVNSRDNL
jgi:predicted acetyltransferase